MSPPPLPEPLAPATLGRKNPFQPLLGGKGSGIVRIPGLPLPPAPRRAGPDVDLAPRRVAPSLTFVGVAYDAQEAIAAVKADSRMVFLRKGDRIQGATVVAITRDRLTLRTASSTFTQPLKRN